MFFDGFELEYVEVGEARLRVRLADQPPGQEVIVPVSWTGAGGVKGFFERTFAPLGLKKIQGEVLSNLKKELES